MENAINNYKKFLEDRREAFVNLLEGIIKAGKPVRKNSKCLTQLCITANSSYPGVNYNNYKSDSVAHSLAMYINDKIKNNI